MFGLREPDNRRLKDEMKDNKGFSLIELLIVVVILAVVAAIAIPNLLASRRAANEGSAIKSLRLYHTAQMTYQSSFGSGSFAGDSAALNTQALADLNAVDMIDGVLAAGIKSGYSFTGAAVPANGGFPAQTAGFAEPVTPTGVARTGNRVFAILTDGVILTADYGALAVSTNGGTNITQTGGVPLND